MTPHSSRLLRQILVAVFLVTSLLLLTIFNATKPRILVLHSLSQASSWTSAMDAGFNKVLASNRMPVSVTRDYLNLDILADGVDTQVLTAAVGRKIEQFDPHVLIAVDDETSELVARHYVGRRDMKIIYTGLMDEPESYGYTASSGVWGIREQLPLQAMNRLLEQMHPTKSLNIAVVGVDDLTGRAEMEQVLRYDWGHHRIKAQALVGNFEAWRTFVSGAARGADILLVLTTDKIPAVPGSRRMAPEADVNAWTELHAVPLPMGVRASYVRFGGGLAVSSSPTELGAKAMEMALIQLANPEQRPSASSQVNSSYDISIRRSAWVRRGFKPPEIYLEAARAAGQLYP